MRTTALLAIFLLSVAVAAAAPQVIMESGRRITGTAIRADDEGVIYLTTPEGELTFPPGTTIIVDEPAAYRAALSLMEQKRYAEALEGLRKVIDNYRFLLWDKKAEKLMAAALLGMKQYDNAVAAYERVFRHSPEVKEEPDVWSNYLEALLGAEQDDKLKEILDETARQGAREVAAKAQMMRARMNWNAGRTEEALYDFLRTAELFTDVPEYQAEAHYRTGECLARLGDPRAQDFFEKVTSDFADSPYASEARSK